MRAIEYRTHDRSAWPSGEWNDEPDKAQWVDEKTGLPCLAVRNRYAAWCGYVGVSEGHSFFGVDYESCSQTMHCQEDCCEHRPVARLDAHGGITFSGFCQEHAEERGVCHLVEPSENDRVWWLGFDCSHAGDYGPVDVVNDKQMGLSTTAIGTYKSLRYVRRGCRRLAAQLKHMEEHGND